MPGQGIAAHSAPHNPQDELTNGCERLVGNLLPGLAHSKFTRQYTSACQGSQQVRIVFLHALLGGAQFADALAGVQHRGVVASTEGITELG